MAMTWSKLLNPNRRRQTSMPTDHREQFERDYDRAIFSTPVKRLQDKAQVFPLEPHDAVRTRLTHSLEVSSVARGLATLISPWLLEQRQIEEAMTRQIESVARCCGLIHDLGNPPFGHAGEAAIQGWFEEERFKDRKDKKSLAERLDGRDQLVQDFLKFEGNAQTLRLVAKLQILADQYGLNLTYATLSAACKYIAPSHEAGVPGGGNHACDKPGFFASENKLIQEIRDQTGTGAARHPITFLVEAADDIVYSVADIEDGIKKGVLGWNEFLEELSGCEPKISPTRLDEIMAQKNKILGSDGREPTEQFADDIHASDFRTAAIGFLVGAASENFKSNYDSIIDGNYHFDLLHSEDCAPFIEGLKSIGRKRIYCTPSTLKLELAGRHIIGDLMDLFWEGAKVLPSDKPPKPKCFPGKLGTLLSESYRRVYHMALSDKTLELPEEYLRFQLVTDYVCGMTDSFAKRLHAELTNG